jgi:hypothetical protein
MESSDILEIIETNKRFIESRQASTNGSQSDLHPDIVASQIPIISTSTVDWIAVKPAKYGRGVFATKPLKTGQYATFYPCHQIVRRKNTQDKNWDIISPEDHPTHYRDYNLTLSPTLGIAGIPSFENLLFCGHLINDPCKDVKIKHLRNSRKLGLQDWLSRYDYLKPNTEYHVVEDVWVVLKVIRDIEPGEELTVCYGTTYWIHRQ